MYVCPDCKIPLENLFCKMCHSEFSSIDGIPLLLSKRPEFRGTLHIAGAYDSIYRDNANVWEKLGRNTEEFIQYFSSLLDQFQSARFLEIGCGEGVLLAAVRVGEKFAIDLSTEAIKVARTKTQAQFSVALAEGLPFAAEYFDLIVSVGVMEHFLDEKQALQEIRRVLKSGGHYVGLIHVDLTFWERFAIKLSQYFFPRPRPIRFARWLGTKLISGRGRAQQEFVKQPIQNKYTTHSVKACLQTNGFKVIDVIHTRKYPELPLIGHFVVIYIGQK